MGVDGHRRNSAIVTADRATDEGIPLVRARFYHNGREVHVEDIPAKSDPIPTEVDERSLSKSANAEIPGDLLEPGLEMVIEIDPDGTLDPGLGVARRIPAETSPVTEAAGVAKTPGRWSFSLPVVDVMAHELGHNMNLRHAPCGPVGASADPSYPYPSGSIGAWGYDFRDGGKLVQSSTPDLMSYCHPQWISDYSFTNALRYRLFDEGPPANPAAMAAATRSLLLWGGVRADGGLYLEPAFVVEAPRALPDSAGEYRITGHSETGAELFRLNFTMPEVADGDGSSSFAFALPVRPGWETNLATITLSGPEGTVTLDEDSDIPMVILRNPRTGQVRGFLRNLPLPPQAAMDAAGQVAGPGLEVLFSRGIPGAEAWRR